MEINGNMLPKRWLAAMFRPQPLIFQILLQALSSRPIEARPEPMDHRPPRTFSTLGQSAERGSSAPAPGADLPPGGVPVLRPFVPYFCAATPCMGSALEILPVRPQGEEHSDWNGAGNPRQG